MSPSISNVGFCFPWKLEHHQKSWLNGKEVISIPNQAFNLLDAFQKHIVVWDVVKVLLVQAWDALHISAVALPDAGCQSSRRGLLCEGWGWQQGRQESAPTHECRAAVQEWGSRARPVNLIRVGLSPAVARQVHKGKAALKSGHEFQLLGQGPGAGTWSGISSTQLQ